MTGIYIGSPNDVAMMEDEEEEVDAAFTAGGLLDMNLPHNEDEDTKKLERSRNYQAALLEMARKQNIIICLPTGSGKTFIAFQLAKEYLSECIEHKKKIVFLTNTVPLALQQAEYFRERFATGVVSYFIGEMDVDLWSTENWTKAINGCHIMVMTAQIFYNILNRHIRFDEVVLLILDECHNAGKSHPMNQIMVQYREIGSGNRDYKLPRVLGLTATIIRGIGKIENIKSDVEAVEQNICASAVTYFDHAEVMKHSTDASLERIYFDTNLPEEDRTLQNAECREYLLQPLREVLLFLGNVELSDEVSVKQEEENNIPRQNMYGNKKNTVKDIRNLVSELMNIFNDLGAHLTRLACLIRTAYLMAKLAQESDACRVLVFKRVITALRLFVRRAGELGVSVNSVTNKLIKLKELFQKHHPKRSNYPLCALVFVKLRITAQLLHWYTHDLSKNQPAEFGYLKSNFILGTRMASDMEEARMRSKKQRDTIAGFYKKKYNIIFCTQVLEEGLNVPECNLVVRFDSIDTFASYVQSMGRGRKKGAHFMVFINSQSEEVAAQVEQKYDNFKHYNGALCLFLSNNAFNLSEEEVEATPDEMEALYPPFCPGGTPNSPKITMGAAVQLVNQYVQSLQSDRFGPLECVSWWEAGVNVDGVQAVRAHVLLPRNSVFGSKITGPFMPNKALAKRAAHLEVCKILYEKNALDANLIPRPRIISEEVNKFLNLIEVEENTEGGVGKVGTKKRLNWYRKMKPRHFEDLTVHPFMSCLVYKLEFDLFPFENVDPDKVSAYTFHNKKFCYGIIIQKELDMIPEFQLETKFGRIICKLKNVTEKCKVALSVAEIRTLREHEKYVFQEVLDIKLGLTDLSEETPYLIAPLIQDDESMVIFWDGVENIKEYDRVTEYRTRPSAEDIVKLDLNLDKYVDSLVVPWYRPGAAQVYCVSSILADRRPSSPFETIKYSTYEDYFMQKYSLRVQHAEQPLLKCCPIAKQLNFLVNKVDPTPPRANQRKWEIHRSSVITLLPEFVNVFPFPGSLFVQMKFLPSVMHRLDRLLLAREIRISVAESCLWNAAINSDKGIRPVSGQQPSTNRLESRFQADEMSKLEDPEVPPRQNAFDGLLELARKAIEHASNGEEVQVEDIQPKPIVEDYNSCLLDYVHPAEIQLDAILKEKTEQFKRNAETQAQNSKRFKKDDVNLTLEEDYMFLPIEESVMPELEKMPDIHLDSLETKFDLSKDQGPDVFKIMEAITLANAQDSMSLECLEMIGDSFLKYCATMHIYTNFPDYDEGQMTTIRGRLISNAALCTAGKKKKLGEVLSGGIFIPDASWLPPGYCVHEDFSKLAVEFDRNFDIFDVSIVDKLKSLSLSDLREECRSSLSIANTARHTTLTHSRLGDKNIADCVEALIGAYYTSGGPQCALLFMDALNLRAPNASGDPVKYGNWDLPPPRRDVEWISTHSMLLGRFLPFINDLQELICYRFQDPWYLVEAFSHPGYNENRGTSSYERLEFLGDAVLDFLITNHIYNHSNAKTPGDLTDLRSALVNNVTFGSLAVRYGLHKFLLHHSKDLEVAIEIFEREQKVNGHLVTGHFTLLSDFETPVAEDVDVPKILGDIFESLAGAVFLDCGMSLDTVWKIFYRLMKNEIDEFSKVIPISPLRQIYESYPSSVRVHHDNPDAGVSGVRSGYCVASITIDGKNYFGLGKSKQSAKMAAAKYVIKSLRTLIAKTPAM